MCRRPRDWSLAPIDADVLHNKVSVPLIETMLSAGQIVARKPFVPVKVCHPGNTTRKESPMPTRILKITTVVAALGLGTLSHAESNPSDLARLLPAGFVEDTGGAIRVEAADALRTITQEVPAAVCHLHNGVETELALELAQHGLDRFALLSSALLDGNPELGIIGGEENRRLRLLIETFQEEWSAMHDAAMRVMADPGDVAAVEAVYGLATPMLDRSGEVMSKISGLHVIPSEMLAGDAMLLEVAERQAMQTQRLSFLACRKWSGDGNAAYDEHLQTTMEQYAFGFRALLNGAPSLGIIAPPTDEIRDALADVNADFEVVVAKIEEVIETDDLDAERAGALYRILSKKLLQMEEVAHLYAMYSKRIF